MKHLSRVLIGLLIATSTARAGEPGVKQTIAFLQKLQTSSGGFLASSAPSSVPTLRSTSAGVRALHYFGGDISNKDACIKFVESCYDPPSGGFSDVPKGKPEIFTTAVGLMAVVELKMPAEKYASGAVKYLSDNAKTFEEIRIAVAGLEAINKLAPRKEVWLREINRLENKDGTYGKGLSQARDTGGAVVAVLRLGFPPAKNEMILKVLKDGQRQNGGYGKDDSPIASDLETTYRVMRCFVMLKAQPTSVEGVRSFVAKCRNEDGGYGVAPGQPSSVGGTYFAGIILHWLK